MMRELLASPVGWLLILCLVVAVAWMAAGIYEILADPPLWLPKLVAAVLIAYSLVRAPRDTHRPVSRRPIRRKDR